MNNLVIGEQEICLKNLVRYRGKKTEIENRGVSDLLKRELHENGVEQIGPVITCTHGFENYNGNIIVDMEVLVPVNKKPDNMKLFNWLDSFSIKNALVMVCECFEHEMQKNIHEYFKIIQEKQLVLKTPLYVSNLGEGLSGKGIHRIQLYAGV